jgi:hypothetical protein
MNKDLCENILGLIVIGTFKKGKEDDLSSFEVDDFYAVNNKNFEYVITDKKHKTTTKRKDTRLIEYFSLFHRKYDPTEIESIDDIASMNDFKNKKLKDGQVMIFINAVIKNEKIIAAYKDGVDGEIKISNFDKTEDFNENGIMEIIMNCVEHDKLTVLKKRIQSAISSDFGEKDANKISEKIKLDEQDDIKILINEYITSILQIKSNKFVNFTYPKDKKIMIVIEESFKDKIPNYKHKVYNSRIRKPDDKREMFEEIEQNYQNAGINIEYLWNGTIFRANFRVQNEDTIRTLKKIFQNMIINDIFISISETIDLQFDSIKHIIKNKFVKMIEDCIDDKNKHKNKKFCDILVTKMKFKGGKTRKKKKRVTRNKKTKTIKQLLKRFLYR